MTTKNSRYYRALYKEALDEDRRALVQYALMNVSTSRVDDRLFGGNFWRRIRADKRMDIARGIASELDSWFTEELKTMLLRGKISVYGKDARGQRVRIKDPSVIDFDDMQMSPGEFFVLLPQS